MAMVSSERLPPTRAGLIKIRIFEECAATAASMCVRAVRTHGGVADFGRQLPPMRGLVKARIMEELSGTVASMTSKAAAGVISCVAAFWQKSHHSG